MTAKITVFDKKRFNIILKNTAIFTLLLLLAMPSVLASITLSPLKGSYNLGDKIIATASVWTDAPVDTIITMALDCPSYEMNFFASPVSLSANEKKTIEVNPLAVVESMQGECTITCIMKTIDKNFLDEISSKPFLITSIIPFSYKLNKDTYLPGEEITVFGIFNLSYGQFQGITKFKINNITRTFALKKNDFDFSFDIPKNIKSGPNDIIFTANDDLGNSIIHNISFLVLPVPTSLFISLDKREALPLDKIIITPILYDQAGDSMKTLVEIKITGQGKTRIENAAAGEPYILSIGKYDLPGEYKVQASYEGLTTEEKFNVKAIENLSLLFDNRTITAINTGNIIYKKPLDIALSGARLISLKKSLSLKPGQNASFDLFSEIPAGMYDISISSGNLTLSYKGIRTSDKRLPFSKIMGAVVGVGNNNSGSLLAVILFVVVASAAVTMYFISKNRRRQIGTEAEENKVEDNKDNIIQNKEINEDI